MVSVDGQGGWSLHLSPASATVVFCLISQGFAPWDAPFS